MDSSLGVVGLGRMAQALLLPLIKNESIPIGNICAVVKSAASIKRINDQFPKGFKVFTSEDQNAKEVWKSSIVLLAVKPQQLNEVITSTSLNQLLNPNTLLISVLAGVSLKKLQKSFPNQLCVRAVPNTPAFVGAGLTGISWGKGVTTKERLLTKELFSPVSEVLELPESQLDAFLALTSSGPAYIALISEALADGAVAAGLPRDLASYLAHRTIGGTAELLNQKDLHPGQLKDMVTSPAGTTIAALRELEKAGLRSALIEAVIAATERSKELSALSN